MLSSATLLSVSLHPPLMVRYSLCRIFFCESVPSICFLFYYPCIIGSALVPSRCSDFFLSRSCWLYMMCMPFSLYRPCLYYQMRDCFLSSPGRRSTRQLLIFMRDVDVGFSNSVRVKDMLIRLLHARIVSGQGVKTSFPWIGRLDRKFDVGVIQYRMRVRTARKHPPGRLNMLVVSSNLNTPSVIKEQKLLHPAREKKAQHPGSSSTHDSRKHPPRSSKSCVRAGNEYPDVSFTGNSTPYLVSEPTVSVDTLGNHNVCKGFRCRCTESSCYGGAIPTGRVWRVVQAACSCYINLFGGNGW